MDDSLIPSLKKTALRVVRNAARPGGSLEQGVFTMFMARSEIEGTMGLDEGELGKGRWKSMVKELVNAAVDNIDSMPSSSRASSSSYPSLSSSPSPLAQSTTTKSRSKSKASSSRSIKAKKSKRQESDEEDEYHSNSPKKIHKCGPKKRKSKGKKVDNESESEEEVIANDDSDEGFPSSMPKSTPPKRPSDKKEQRKEEQEEEKTEPRKTYVEEPQARMSDSDMSSVYDEPPSNRTKSRKSASVPASGKRKSKSKSVSVMSSDEEKPSSKKRKGSSKNKKDPNEGLSPDEARLADLKRIVVACGVRKQWAKEFADCPTTSSQIRHVQGLLSSLGIKGQPTLGKAKTLKAKRELAQELDDVKTFEAARGLSSDTRERRSRATSATKRKKVVGSDDEEEDEEEDDEAIELDKEESALGAVLDLDFLGGDSDSD
ncbi:hypothetical protein V866_007811 [Kwoniella sp. B9012]